MTVKKAAELLGWSEAYVRHACKERLIGDAYSGGGKRWTCVIYHDKIAERLGITTEELNRRLNT